MKVFFAVATGLLIVLSVGTYFSFPGVTDDRPVLFWTTDPNPARERQVEVFERWLVDNGYTAKDGGPRFILKLDTGNRKQYKQIIQGVSGVAGDIMDTSSGAQMRLFQAMGILDEVTDAAKDLGYDPTATYPAVKPEIGISVDGRYHQYMFPCNVSVFMFWVNGDTFKQYGQPMPPKRWTWDEFERRGQAFVDAANPPGERHSVFFANDMSIITMFRSLGLSVVNETGTACDLNDPRYIRTLKRKYKWIEDQILPSAAQQSAFATESGYGGAKAQLFNRGQYAMIFSGRYMLIQLRKFGSLDLHVVEPPHAGFPNTHLGTRAASVYIGREHKDLARLFQAYLASEAYNMQIVRDADALPPNPKYTKTELYNRPPDHPNEWGTHDAFAKAAQTIAIGGAYTSFILQSDITRLENQEEDRFLEDQQTAEQTAANLTRRINAQIRQNLHDNPTLRPRYRQLVQRQAEIDKLRAQGKKVPLDWIENPFYRNYYQAQGWAE